jgi:hypothetical protein
VKPPSRTGSSPPVIISQVQFLSQIEDSGYRSALEEFFELCRGLGLRAEWGSVGVSVRLATQDRAEPHVGSLLRGGSRPDGSAGITNRPDELLHLILDALERTRI